MARNYHIILLPLILWILPLDRTFCQSAVEGIIDLRHYDFQEPILVGGEAEFYWERLEKDPGKLDSLPKEFVPFPSLWNDDGGFTAFGYATYRLRILLPAEPNDYGLIVEDMYCAFNLFANGTLVAGNGRVGTSAENYRPEWKSLKVDLPGRNDTLELVIQIANFDHSKGGNLEPLILGREDNIDRLRANQNAYDLLLTGCLVMGGLFFLGLYFFGRNEKAILFFSLFCISYAYRIIGAGHYVLHNLLEGYPWWLAIRIEYISLFASVYFFSRFLIKIYPYETSILFGRTVWYVCFICFAATVVLPVYYFSQIITPFFIFLLLAFFYTVWVYIRAWQKSRPGSLYAMLSMCVAVFIFSYNILDYFGLLIAEERISFWGYVGFFFSQSLLISHYFSYSMKMALKKAEMANEAKSDFLATISHEIRTPLNAIVGMAHLTLRNEPREDQIKNLESLTFSAENLTSLINDILDFNKIESGSLQLESLPVNLKEHAEKVVKGYEGQSQVKGVPIYLEIDPKIYDHLEADPIRISQVLNNLINNALKFTAKGRIDVQIRLLQDLSETQVIDVSVRDTGPGIHKDQMELIFERFTQASSTTTREFGGTGLGLSIVRGILQLYGSQINVKSTLGQGSVFSFEIKLKKAKNIRNQPLKDDKKIEERDLNILGGKEVLVVEDNIMNMMIAEQFLDRWGMNLTKATNGHEALEKVSAKTFDLILMDLHMPVMDGYEASIKIKEISPATPIIALTASSLSEQEKRIKAAGMTGHILKPFHPKDLRAKLTQVLSA